MIISKVAFSKKVKTFCQELIFPQENTSRHASPLMPGIGRLFLDSVAISLSALEGLATAVLGLPRRKHDWIVLRWDSQAGPALRADVEQGDVRRLRTDHVLENHALSQPAVGAVASGRWALDERHICTIPNRRLNRLPLVSGASAGRGAERQGRSAGCQSSPSSGRSSLFAGLPTSGAASRSA